MRTGVTVVDSDGRELPTLVSEDGHRVSWRAVDVGSVGWRTYLLKESEQASAWEPLAGVEIANDYHRLRVDPGRGGGVSSLLDLRSGAELIAPGRVGNELAVYEEYPAHRKPAKGRGTCCRRARSCARRPSPRNRCRLTEVRWVNEL